MRGLRLLLSLMAGGLFVFASVPGAAAPGGEGPGGSGPPGQTKKACPEVAALLDDLSSDMADKRLYACRALRKPWPCAGTESGSESQGNPGGQGTGNKKIRIVSTASAPDPFSPEPDGILDTTTLSAKAALRRTDAIGSDSPNHTSFVEFQWTIRSPEDETVRVLTDVQLVSMENPRGHHGVLKTTVSGSVDWDGRDELGQLQPDGAYGWSLTASWRRETIAPGTLHASQRAFDRGFRHVIGEDTAEGTVTIDESVGAALRAMVEEALIERLSDVDPSVRRAATATLQLVGGELSLEPLGEMLANETGENDPITAGFAAFALVRIGTRTEQDVVPLLRAALGGSPSNISRALVARAMGTTYDSGLLAELEAIADDPAESELVREAAKRAVITIENTVPEAP